MRILATAACGRVSGIVRNILGAGACAAALLGAAGAAQAGPTLKFGDDESLSFGLGMRTSATWDEHGASDGSSNYTANLDSVRLYVNGQVTKWLGATFNTEWNGKGSIQVLDGFARFEPTDGFNIWVGHLLPPSDRSNLDGPYYLSSWNYPGVVSQYPARFAGRDDGVTVWGKLFARKLTYAVGVFRGHDHIAGAAAHSGEPLVAGRVAFNFWDVEDNPGYFESSTYYGAANILTLAFAGMYQKNGVGTAAVRGNYASWNVDGLMEHKVFDGGAVTLEGAYYHYSTGGVFDVSPSFNNADPNDNVGGLTQGNAFLISGGFLFPQPVGPGKFQPVVRYQEFHATLTDRKTRQIDASLNYILKGHSARVSLDYAHSETTGSGDDDRVTAGLQLQF